MLFKTFLFLIMPFAGYDQKIMIGIKIIHQSVFVIDPAAPCLAVF